MRIAAAQLVCLVVVSLVPTVANAQKRPQRFTPSRPTVSPYVNLLRNDVSPLTNYIGLVRPQLQQQAINQQQQGINLQQQSLLQTQQQGLRRVQEGLLEVRQPQANPTGTGGGFMNFSHFYSFQSQNAPQRRR